ncbi:TonB-dependent receptor [Zobellia nedashkovskayae]|uniref:TonB-dependent receptor n=1 Tax=Zobellia nedashkovskayae TaxID=2779510 RepID=UPI00188D71C2|nr:TonB-dependent receptor [Zobellia nedashkovskayae]
MLKNPVVKSIVTSPSFLLNFLNLRQNLPLLFFFLLSISSTFYAVGQGTTSARITGYVTDEAGEVLPGATIQATHTPTGFKYATVSNIEGLFTLNNVNVGGPYTIVVSYTGFTNITMNDVFLNLGQTLSLDFVLKENITELEGVTITAGGLFDGNKTGAETKVTLEDLQTIPTSDRGFSDYLRLTPQANIGNAGATNSGGISFAGINNRFNAIFIDGAVNNDVFGLANSGTNGGQAGISPISPDALEQIQVVLAPYDVTLGGFAGGGINAVTRSGTNTFEGSAYFFTRNENLSGKTPTDDPDAERTKLAPFSSKTYGLRLGGPIVKDKLFFFFNAEVQRDENPRPFVANDYNGNSTDIVGDLEAIRNKLINTYDYDPGGYLDNPQTTNGEKVLIKLDWNINEKHKLSARHSYVNADTEIHPTPNSNTVYYGNAGYVFPTTTNSTAIELKSNFSNKISNNLILGRTKVVDDRDILGDPFPQVIIPDGNAQIVVGTDNFSYSNIVDQEIYTLTNNLNIYKGKHTITIGTHNELFSIKNLFTIFSTPQYEYFFNGIDRFLNDEEPDLFLFGHEQNTTGSIRLGDEAENLGPTFKALQMAFYAQDEFQVNQNLKLTLGVRADIPIFLDDSPLDNVDFNTTTVSLIEAEGYDLKGAQAGKTPSTKILWSPRFGFNWDPTGEKKTQIRGGLGIFTSRVPWVWPGGIFIRNGLNSAFNVGVFSGQPIYSDPNDWINNLASTASPTGDVDLFTEDFKYPQIFRSSLAVDQNLGDGFNATLEATYTKTINNLDVKNVNIKGPIDSDIAALNGDDRAIFDLSDLIDDRYTDIMLVDNTNKGYSFNLTAQLSKSWQNGFDASASYSFTRADALFDGSGFINGTNWDNILSVNGNNNPSVGRSIYDAASRITGFFSYRTEYAKNFATGISLFYSGQSGMPYSYVYSAPFSDVSNSAGYDDILYVPASQADITFVDQTNGDGQVIASAAQQWADFDSFISGNDYLNDRRGDYVEQNKVRTPFEHVIDLKITQDFFIKSGNTKHTLQLSFDVFNFTNMINKNWGRRYFVSGNTFPLLTTVIDDDGALQGFQFNDPGDTYDIVQSGTYSARWNAQFGIRYSF